MNKQELKRVIRLGLKTVSDVGRYLHRLKTQQNELKILIDIKQ
jgi:hypothetical protein